MLKNLFQAVSLYTMSCIIIVPIAWSCNIQNETTLENHFHNADYVLTAKVQSKKTDYYSMLFKNINRDLNVDEVMLYDFNILQQHKGHLTASTLSVAVCPGFKFHENARTVLFVRDVNRFLYVEGGFSLDRSSELQVNEKLNQRLSKLSRKKNQQEKSAFCFALYTCSNLYELWPF